MKRGLKDISKQVEGGIEARVLNEKRIESCSILR